MSTTKTTLFVSSGEEEVLIKSATTKEYWVDELTIELQQLPPQKDNDINHQPTNVDYDDVGAGFSPQPAENKGFLDVQQNYQVDRHPHLFNLPPLDPDDFMDDGDRDQPTSIIINEGAAGSSDRAAAPIPGAAAVNNGFLVPDHSVQYYQDGRLQLRWRGSGSGGFRTPPSTLGGTNKLGGFGHQQGQVALSIVGQLGGAIPPISGTLNYFNIPPPMLQPFSTQDSGAASSILNITHQNQNLLRYRDNNVPDHPLNKKEICCMHPQAPMNVATSATCRGDYQEYHPSLPYRKQVHVPQGDNYFPDHHTPTSHHHHNSPWPAHHPQWDQISFPKTDHSMLQPTGIPTPIPIPSSSTSNGVAENHQKKHYERWTVEEHKNMLRGIEKYGKGNWKSISREFVKTKSAVQVASHAQKLDARQKENKEIMQAAGISVHRKRKRRSSIHDITIDHVDPSLSSNN